MSVLVGFFGCVGAFSRSKGLLVSYACVLAVLILIQIILGGIIIGYSGNEDKIREYGSQLWDVLSADQRSEFQKSNDCIGYALLIDRPGPEIPITVNISPCAPAVVKTIKYLMRGTGVYLFITAVLEMFAGAIAFVLIRDENKRMQGFSYGYSS